jgi:hypothetical protein
MLNRYFIAVYTNQVKDYCDEVFFSNLYKVSRSEPVFIIDNTVGDSYYRKLQTCLRNMDIAISICSTWMFQNIQGKVGFNEMFVRR